MKKNSNFTFDFEKDELYLDDKEEISEYLKIIYWIHAYRLGGNFEKINLDGVKGASYIHIFSEELANSGSLSEENKKILSKKLVKIYMDMENPKLK